MRTLIIVIRFSVSNGAGGDPHFLVNLPDNSNLCFSLQGEPGFAFNLVTSRTVVINAVFIHSPPALQEWTTVIGEIGMQVFVHACTHPRTLTHTYTSTHTHSHTHTHTHTHTCTHTRTHT